ncbi:hypothetical protein DY218_27480 [Streptomyces triticagri]|uniref:Uncharacterized protein n=1 Tax=Streptomyces triticagri TaxID=2293568 RepID=A0A372LYC0_9ACTN|nr:hypothetical protein [Streptomyces triticagri]RFU83652.1 hypothetical protein DY218_27480 [Streptomyces triticagri]
MTSTDDQQEDRARARAMHLLHRGRRAQWPVTARRRPDDTLIAAFEDHTGPRPQLILDVVEEMTSCAHRLAALGVADRYGVFIDLYMRRPAVFLRDRRPDEAPHPALALNLGTRTEKATA